MPRITLSALSLGALLLLGLLASPPALAHKLLVSATVEGKGGLKVLAFFPDGTPAQEVLITVTPSDGSAPREGRTDSQGVCLLSGLKPGFYRVVAGDPLGHRAETTVVIPGASGTGSQGNEKEGAAAPAKATDSPIVRGEPLPWGNILAGLGFIFGLTALVMVLKLKSDLRRYAPRD
ncbi:MAG: carboxypeptidase regulatory-like domain-containing protein [Deltaproteobacteria bacterium]|nr:carboxypeptidase regulatory-like domain-containing protein [Deltaproteobacteria bacterium]